MYNADGKARAKKSVPVSTIFDLKSTVTLNDRFRYVLETTDKSQLAMMHLQPGQEIGRETHDGDQFIYIESGKGLAILNGKSFNLFPGVGFIIPAGTEHNIIASIDGPLKLFTIYAPPEH